MEELTALYLSDFYIKNKHHLNTLCLFYDRLFIHDYFGIFICVDSKSTYDAMQERDKVGIDTVWSVAGGLDEATILLLRSCCETEFDHFVLKGVAQGLGCASGRMGTLVRK